jgi:hypothetical protein
MKGTVTSEAALCAAVKGGKVGKWEGGETGRDELGAWPGGVASPPQAEGAGSGSTGGRGGTKSSVVRGQ